MNPNIFVAAGLLFIIAGCGQDHLLLLPGDDGKTSSGAVAVLSDKGKTTAVIDRAYADASIGSGSVEQNIVDAAEVERRYGALLKSLPLPPKNFLIYFKRGTANLTAKSASRIDTVFAEIKARPGADVQIVGGSPQSEAAGAAGNKRYLSLIQRHVIAQMLVSRGLDKSRVSIVSGGKIELPAKTKDKVGDPRYPGVKIIVR
jgi:outer membrane protein OmpA-like peptidoglycan-associated protein